MVIGGLQKFSLLDYPGKISAIIFTQGCNFRCHFCYNPLLVGPITSDKIQNNKSQLETKEKDHTSADSKQNSQQFGQIKEDDLFRFLKERVGKLEGVVVTGGEPLLHKDVEEFIAKIKKLGFLIKLDTNGTSPEKLQRLIDKRLIDYIAMDIKGSKENYKNVVDVDVDFKIIEKSVKIVMNSSLPYEFRTTVVPGLLDVIEIKSIGKFLKGSKNWFLQSFKSDVGLVDNKFEKQKSFTEVEMNEMKKIALKYVDNCEIR
jgi:pyruvate formate lyase activating enzyme